MPRQPRRSTIDDGKVVELDPYRDLDEPFRRRLI
jgi:hypothetical protein